jgi:hypothetical protein
LSCRAISPTGCPFGAQYFDCLADRGLVARILGATFGIRARRAMMWCGRR